MDPILLVLVRGPPFPAVWFALEVGGLDNRLVDGRRGRTKGATTVGLLLVHVFFFQMPESGFEKGT